MAVPTGLRSRQLTINHSTLPGGPGATITPASITPITTGLGPATTDSAKCSVCSPYALNGMACTRITGCTPHTPEAYVQAGNQSVHVGTLTSMELSSSISSAIATLCPPVTQTQSMTNCESDTVKIPGIVYKEEPDGTLSRGELDVTVKSSQYNATSLRDAMISAAALTAMQSATDKNCYTENFTVLKKRNWLPHIVGRWFGLHERTEAIEPIQDSMTMCVAASFAGVQYFPEWIRQADNFEENMMWIDAEWDFHAAPGTEMTCEFIQILIDALAVVAPEFTAEDVALGQEIEAVCKAAMTLSEDAHDSSGS